MKLFSRTRIAYLGAAALFLLCFFVLLPMLSSDHYISSTLKVSGQASSSLAGDSRKNISTSTPVVSAAPLFVATHVAPPAAIKGIYMTSWVASSQNLRSSLVALADQTEVNAIVIDIKDYSGKIVYSVEDNTALTAYGSEEVRDRDMREFIDSLHKKGIYVIGRAAVFQDAYFIKYRPDLAVKNKAGTAAWKDHKGISWIDAGSREYWDYIIMLAKESYGIGFDEINFDYVRFPSDGNMKDISFPQSSTTPKATVIKNFFSYLHEHLAGTGLKTSADLFGMTTTATDDMGIGQVLENALPYFDYIDPMVYPSHYPATFMGYKNPEQYPYQVVQYAMKSAVEREKALAVKLASSTPNAPHPLAELRPWLQDFGLTMDYTAADVRAQIKATNDDGLSSWLLWSASNKYTKGALDPK